MSSPAPHARPIVEALGASEALAKLTQRLRESASRYEAVRDVLPANLRDSVRPGPIDDNGWTLLTPHPAAAAKVRQLVPALEKALVDKGWQATPIRVRIQSKV